MSFWFDGNSRVYFPYVLDPDSRKVELSRRASVARLLVYRAETPFNWRSVLLTGRIDEVPESEQDVIREAMETRGRPAVFERASTSENTSLYELRIADRTGIEHLGVPPRFEADSAEPRPG
jgi:hypothetical protein